MPSVGLKYNDYEDETAQAEQEESDASGGPGFVKIKEGKNYLRILPPTGEARSPFRVTYQHFINMPGANGKTQSVICARMEAKKHCQVCEMVDRLRESQSKQDQDAANDLFVRRRVFCNVIDRNDEEAGPKVWAFGKQVHEQLLALRTDRKGGGNYVDPINGFDIIVDRKGTGKNNTEYTIRGNRDSSPLADSEEVMQEWIDTQHNLNQYARLPDNEKVAGLLPGGEEEEEEERPAPVRKPAAVAQRPSAAARAGGSGRYANAPRETAPAPKAAARPARRTAEDDAIDIEPEEEEG